MRILSDERLIRYGLFWTDEDPTYGNACWYAVDLHCTPPGRLTDGPRAGEQIDLEDAERTAVGWSVWCENFAGLGENAWCFPQDWGDFSGETGLDYRAMEDEADRDISEIRGGKQ